MTPPELEFDDDDIPVKPTAKPAPKPGTAAQAKPGTAAQAKPGGPTVPAKPPTTAVAKPGTVIPATAPAKPATSGIVKPANTGIAKPSSEGISKPAAAGIAKPAAAGISKPATASLAKAEAEKPAIAASAAAATPLAAAGAVSYAFEESDEAPKPKRPVVFDNSAAAPPVDEDPLADEAPKPAAKPAPGKPGTGRVPAKSPSSAQRPAAERATPAAEKPVPAAPDKPVQATPDVTDGDDNDPDIKPGSRKDLWKCPHCGTGNKPGREDCRKCGKSPDDEVEIAWINKPQSWAVIGVVALVTVLLLFVLTRTDISQHPADAGHVDSSVRVGGHPASGTSTIDGKTFTPQRQLSVVGRCLDSSPSNDVSGLVTLVLLLGSDATRDDALQVHATFNNQRTEIPDGTLKKYAVFHLFPGDGVDRPVLTRGSYVSIVGDLGEIEGFSGGFEEYTVRVQKFQSSGQ